MSMFFVMVVKLHFVAEDSGVLTVLKLISVFHVTLVSIFFALGRYLLYIVSVF